MNESDKKEPQNSEPKLQDDTNSLETSANESKIEQSAITSAPKKSVGSRINGFISHLNIYLLLFILIAVISSAVVFIAYQRNKKAAAPTTVTTTSLSGDSLEQIKSSDAKVGDPKQTLTIESNAIFSGKVLIRDSLDVAGGLKVGGSLSLPGIAVSGAASFDQIQANTLGISGNASIQGQLTVQKGITSTSGATFGGPISAPSIATQSLQLSGDLQVIRHIDAGGSTPGKTDGSALGNGGTASISGTDTSGTITINTGGSPAIGCFINVSFVNKFAGTPHVIITPVGSAGAGLSYYTSRTSSGFSVCATNAAPAGQTFNFDYVAID